MSTKISKENVELSENRTGRHTHLPFLVAAGRNFLVLVVFVGAAVVFFESEVVGTGTPVTAVGIGTVTTVVGIGVVVIGMRISKFDVRAGAVVSSVLVDSDVESMNIGVGAVGAAVDVEGLEVAMLGGVSFNIWSCF
jgi:hypothetical protein